MIDTLTEARRARAVLISRLTALRQNFDREIGLVLTELHRLDTLELEAARQARELLSPELYAGEPER